MADRPLILLDFDGTLATNSGRWSRVLLGLAREVEPYFPATVEQVRARLRTGFPWHSPDVAHPGWAPSDWWGIMTGRLRDALVALGLDGASAAEAAGRFRARYLHPADWTVYPDVLPALGALASAGFRLAILSNHVPELAGLVAALGLADRFEAIFTSGRTGYEKPNPEAYAIALRALGRPARAFMAGDNPVADVIGAEAAGLRGILVRGDDPRAPRRCAGLSGLPALLAGSARP